MRQTLVLTFFLILLATPRAVRSETVLDPADIDVTTTSPEVTAPHSPQLDPEQQLALDQDNPLVTFYNFAIRNRLEVGVRRTKHKFKETQKGDRQTRQGTYFGTINQIIVDDDRSFNNLFFQYALHPWVAIGYNRDDYRLITRDGPTPQETDGDFTIDSRYIYLQLRYRFDFGLQPFVEYGRGTHKVDFDPLPAWAARGNTVTMNDRETASFLTYGVEYYFNDHVSIHVMQRRTDYTMTGQYTVRDGRAPVDIEIRADQTITGFGIKVIF